MEHKKNMDSNTATLLIQKDIETINKSIGKIETLLGVYATKQELAAAMKEVEYLVYKEIGKLENKLDPITNDLKSRKLDRGRLYWLVMASFVSGMSTLVFTILSKVELIK